MEQEPRITMSGTWDIKEVADILGNYKLGKISLADCIWKLMECMK